MKAFDIDVPLALRAVIHAETAEQAEQLARQLADRFAGASDCLSGSAYGTPQATEFSIHDLPATGEGKIEIEEAYDLAELDAACRTDGCDGDPDQGDGWDGYCGQCADELAHPPAHA